MTKAPNRGVKFLLTRVATGASAVAMFVSLWAGVAAASQKDAAQPSSTEDSGVAAPIEQDGWRWDPVKNDWVAIEQPAVAAQPAPAPAQEHVVVIERQPIYYYTYVQASQPSGAAAGTAAGKPAITQPPDSSSASGAAGTSAASGAPAPGGVAGPASPGAAPAFVPPSSAPGAGPAAAPSAPSSAPAAPAPAAPAPAAPAPAAPAPAPAAAAPAPSAPPPKPAAAPPKTTKAS